MLDDTWSLATEVAVRLDEAGLTLARMRMTGFSLVVRTGWPEIVRELWHDEPPDERLNVPRPTPAEITRMDEAFGWLAFLPDHPDRLRLIVNRRLLIQPLSGKHRYSWRRLGEEFGCDHKTAKAWHFDAVARIAKKIALTQFSISRIPQFLACQSS